MFHLKTPQFPLRLLIIFTILLGVQALILPKGYSDEPSSEVNLVKDVAYQVNAADGLYHMVVEIPSGTVEKWQTNEETGQLYHEMVEGKPRNVQFLAYPGNYGFIPQTYYDKAEGGDGDPLDVLLLAPSTPRGSKPEIRILGALKFVDTGEADDKLLAIDPKGPFADSATLSELLLKHPGAVEVVKIWFENYKTPGRMVFVGYSDRDEAIEIVEKTHAYWLKHTSSVALKGEKKKKCPCTQKKCAHLKK